MEYAQTLSLSSVIERRRRDRHAGLRERLKNRSVLTDFDPLMSELFRIARERIELEPRPTGRGR